MINGTQLITSIGAEAVERAGIIARQADVVAALTLEVLKGSSRAFDPGKKIVVVVVAAVVVGVRGCYCIIVLLQFFWCKFKNNWHA